MSAWWQPSCPVASGHRGTSAMIGFRGRPPLPWHTNCLGVSGNQLTTTQRSWTFSRPKSPNTGSPARRCLRARGQEAGGTIRCRRPNRKPGRNSPNASTRRAAFTDPITHWSRRIGRVARAGLRSAGRPRQPVPLARYLPPGGLFFAISIRPPFVQEGSRSRQRERDGNGTFRTASLLR